MKPPLTLTEHQQASAALTVIDDQIAKLVSLLNNRRGVRARTLDRLVHIDGHLSNIRTELEETLCQAHPKAGTDIYFPSDEVAR